MGRYMDMGTYGGNLINFEPGSATSFSLSNMRR